MKPSKLREEMFALCREWEASGKNREDFWKGTAPAEPQIFKIIFQTGILPILKVREMKLSYNWMLGKRNK